MACILLWSSAVRVHDSQAHRKMDVTRERISRILELREILVSFQTGFSLVNSSVACADLDTATVKIEKVEINSAWFHVCGPGYGNGSGYGYVNLFWSDHVAIFAVPYGLTGGRVPYFRHFLCCFLPFFPASGKTMPKISKITKEETEQLTELVRGNVPLYDQSSSDYSNAPFISLTANFVLFTQKKN